MKEEIKYAPLFMNYRIKNYCKDPRLIEDASDLFITIEKLLEKYDAGEIDPIRDYFKNQQQTKSRAKRIIDDFNRYLREHEYKEFDGAEVAGVMFFNSAEERHLSVLKIMHEPDNKTAIGRKAILSDDTIDDYLKDFKYGYKFFETDLKGEVVRAESKQKKTLRSTIHPIFLALNLSELNTLMLYLQKSNNKEIKRVGNLIYTQMTEYAKNLCSEVKSFENIRLEYNSEYEHLVSNAPAYLLKMNNMVVDFYYYNNDGEKIFASGRVTDFDDAKYKILTTDDSVLWLEKDEIHVTTDINKIYNERYLE